MKKVAVFGFDVREASQIRSIKAIRATGAQVFSFTFRRDNMNTDFTPDWHDVPLGQVRNGALLKRIPALFKALGPVWRERTMLREADVIVARNFDMVLVALASRMLSLSRTPIVYQCLDIHSIFTAPGLKGRIARSTERLALRHIQRLVVSSPGFIRNYFKPLQTYKGEVALLENRISWDGPRPARPMPIRRKPGPVRLGWVGTLRCPQSLALLARTADLLGDQIEIVLRGVVHDHSLPDFHKVVDARPNMRFEGRYSYPEGLKQAYVNLDLVWAQDLWQPGGNSDWLLPNRIYEAGYFGCPCIAVAGTETANRLEADHLGYVINQAEAIHLVRLLRQTDVVKLQRYKFLILRQPETKFSQQSHEVEAMLDFSEAKTDGVVAHA